MIELNTLSIGLILTSFILSEIISKYLIKEAYLVIKIKNKQRKIRIHHLYVGATLATFAAFFNQIFLFLVGFGVALNDLIKETLKSIKKK